MAYNFLDSTKEYDDKSHLYYDYMCRDFFKYLADQPKQSEYAALGSRQRVRVKKRFEKKAKKAYELCLKAIDASGQKNEREKWRDVFGNGYPAPASTTSEDASASHSRVHYRNTEEFIEDRFPIDIRYDLRIDCEVTQQGFRTDWINEILSKYAFLREDAKFEFKVIDDSDLPPGVRFYWKVLNRGPESRKRDMIRGEIVADRGQRQKHEVSDFKGDHCVECYAVLNGVVVARDYVDVPITRNSEKRDAA